MKTKKLKDYTNRELISEMIKRINNCSLETSDLAILLTISNIQYLGFYSNKIEQRKKSTEKN